MSEPTQPCRHCGRSDGVHSWIEGDCVLRHRRHSRLLVEGTFVCVPCVERHQEWLREIVDLYATLPRVVPAGSIPDDTAEHKHSKVLASPSLFRLDAWAMLHGQVNDRVVDVSWTPDGVRVETVRSAWLGANLPDVPSVLAGWAQAVFDAFGWTAAAPTTVMGAAAVLRSNAETTAGLPDVDSYDDELRWVRSHLRAVHGLSNPQPIGSCLNVGCGGAVWPQPEFDPRCSSCGRKYSQLDLVRLKVNEATEATGS